MKLNKIETEEHCEQCDARAGATTYEAIEPKTNEVRWAGEMAPPGWIIGRGKMFCSSRCFLKWSNAQP